MLRLFAVAITARRAASGSQDVALPEKFSKKADAIHLLARRADMDRKVGLSINYTTKIETGCQCPLLSRVNFYGSIWCRIIVRRTDLRAMITCNFFVARISEP